MKKAIITMLIGAATLGLVGCGSSEAKMTGSYTNAISSDLEYGGTVLGKNYDAYALYLYDNNTYTLTYTDTSVISDTVGGTTAITTYGTYEKGEASDGYANVTLKAADRVVYDSYSTMGGYSMSYDTTVDESYIIPGGDDTSITKEEFVSQLGYAEDKTVYIVLDSSNAETCQFTFDAQ